MQSADLRWPAQRTSLTRDGYLPHSLLHRSVPGADVPTASQPAAFVPPQAFPTGYFGPPPPPPARHLFGNYRRPQHLIRPATQPQALDRVSNRRNTSDAAANPFVRSARGLLSAAPAVAVALPEARDMHSASSGHSFPEGKFVCLLCIHSYLFYKKHASGISAHVLCSRKTCIAVKLFQAGKSFLSSVFWLRAAVNLAPCH